MHKFRLHINTPTEIHTRSKPDIFYCHSDSHQHGQIYSSCHRLDLAGPSAFYFLLVWPTAFRVVLKCAHTCSSFSFFAIWVSGWGVCACFLIFTFSVFHEYKLLSMVYYDILPFSFIIFLLLSTLLWLFCCNWKMVINPTFLISSTENFKLQNNHQEVIV